MSLLFRSRRQAHDALREHRQFTVLVGRLLRDLGVMRAVFGENARHLAVDVKRVAHRIVPADLDVDCAENRRRPSSWSGDATSRSIAPAHSRMPPAFRPASPGRLPNARVRGRRDTELVRDAQSRMLLQLFPGELVGADVKPAPSLRECDKAGHGHRPLHHRLQLVAGLHVLDIARSGAADFLGLVKRERSSPDRRASNGPAPSSWSRRTSCRARAPCRARCESTSYRPRRPVRRSDCRTRSDRSAGSSGRQNASHARPGLSATPWS